MGRRVVFDSAVYRLSLSDKDPFSQIQAMSTIFNTGKRKLNENWRLHQKVLRSAIAQAKLKQLMSDGTIDDRVPCEHCKRKFKAQVAISHIPKCPQKKKRWILYYNII